MSAALRFGLSGSSSRGCPAVSERLLDTFASAITCSRHGFCPGFSRPPPRLTFAMSIADSDTTFLSALQPNTSVTTYGLPSELLLGYGRTMSDEMSRARRVQQQVQMRMAEKSTLPRQNGSASHYAKSGKHQDVFKEKKEEKKKKTFTRTCVRRVFCFMKVSVRTSRRTSWTPSHASSGAGV